MGWKIMYTNDEWREESSDRRELFDGNKGYQGVMRFRAKNLSIFPIFVNETNYRNFIKDNLTPVVLH